MAPTSEILDMAPAILHLCALILAAAVQCFFNILFPDNYEIDGGIYRVGGARTCYQRNFDYNLSGFNRRKCHLVCHAGYGTGGNDLFCRGCSEIHKNTVRKACK